MKPLNSARLRFLQCGLKTIGVLAFGGALVACQTPVDGQLPPSEYALFTPKTTSERVMNEVKLRWEFRDDVVEYCSKTIGLGPNQARLTPPLACAVWHAESKQCTIYTGRQTTHGVIGHEVRHCFEGHFHP